jgi:hypothetical protein
MEERMLGRDDGSGLWVNLEAAIFGAWDGFSGRVGGTVEEQRLKVLEME